MRTAARWLAVGIAVTAAATLVLADCSGEHDAGTTTTRASIVRPPTTVDNPAYGAIADALRGPGGLTVCAEQPGLGDASGSYEQRVFTVAAGACPPAAPAATGTVVVNAYDSAQTRDSSAALDFGDRRAAWTYLQFVIGLSRDAAPEVAAAVERAMAALGAEGRFPEGRSG